MRVQSLCPIALASIFASIIASPVHVETSPIQVTASLPSADQSTLSLHLVRTDDLLSDLDDHSILKRLTHIALRVELDEENLALSINGGGIDLKSLHKDGTQDRVQAVKAEAFTLSDEIKEGFVQGEVMTQSEIVKSALEHLPKGIVSAEIRIAEEELAPSMLPKGSPNEVSAAAQVSMKAFAVTLKASPRGPLTDVDSNTVTHSSSIMIPVLRIELEYDDGEDSVVKMRHYAIQASVRVVDAEKTNGLDVEIAEDEDVEDFEQGRELVEEVRQDEKDEQWRSESESEEKEDNEDNEEDEDKDGSSGEGKEVKHRRPDGGKGRQPPGKGDKGHRLPPEDGHRRPPPKDGDHRPPAPGHGGERRPQDLDNRRPPPPPGHHHHHHHEPPPPPPAWIKWIAERLGVPPPPPPPPFHGRKPHHPHDREDMPPFHGRPGCHNQDRTELASGSKPSGFGASSGRQAPERPHHRPSNDGQGPLHRPDGHRHHHHFGAHLYPHHGPPPFFHRLMHDLPAFFYVLGAALSTPGGRIFSFVVQGLMLVLIVVQLTRAKKRHGSVRLEKEEDEEAALPPPVCSDRKEKSQVMLGPEEELQIKISKA